jgi:uncharacterized protein (TIRG00374 family)
MSKFENPKPRRDSAFRKNALLIARCGISVGLMYLALRHVDWMSVLPLLRSIRLGWIATATLILIVQFTITSFRWKLLLEASGISISFRKTIYFIFIAAFFNQTLPGTFGGDAARIMLLRGAGNQWRPSVNSVVIDRAIGGAALASLVLACCLGTASYLRNSNERLALSGTSLICLMAFLAILFVGKLPTPWRFTRELLDNLKPISRIVFQSFSAPARVVSVIALSIAIHVLSTCSIWCLANALSVDLSIAQGMFLIPPVLLISTVPISIAGWGLRENAMVSLLGYAGVSSATSLLVSILFGLLLVILGGVGGVIWMIAPTKQIADAG